MPTRLFVVGLLMLMTVEACRPSARPPHLPPEPPGPILLDAATVRVEVFDGDPIADVKVPAAEVVIHAEPAPKRTDGAGNVEFDIVPVGPRHLWVTADGFVSDDQHFEVVAPNTVVRVSLRRLPPPPAPPTVRRQGRVRVSHRALVDDGGAFNTLGASLFWGVWGYQHDRARLEQNLAFLQRHGFDYIRVLGAVGPSFGWADRTVNPTAAGYDDAVRGLMDLAYDTFGLRISWTIFGGIDATPTRHDRAALVDRFWRLVVGREPAVLLIEIANEAWQNGFPGEEGIAELRDLARRLQARTEVLVAVTSNHEGDDGICKTYRGGVADVATMHYDRDVSKADGYWRPVRQPWGWPGEYDASCPGELPAAVVNQEAIGPQSSVAEDDDPLRLTMAYVTTFVSGNSAYVLHTGAGIRGGGAADRARGRSANLWEVPQMASTIAGLQAAKAYLPPGLANWQRQNDRWDGYPFENCSFDCFVRAYAAIEPTGARVIVAPIGIRPGGAWFIPKRRSVRAEVLDPLTGTVRTTQDLRPMGAPGSGDRLELRGMAAAVVRGRFH